MGSVLMKTTMSSKLLTILVLALFVSSAVAIWGNSGSGGSSSGNKGNENTRFDAKGAWGDAIRTQNTFGKLDSAAKGSGVQYKDSSYKDVIKPGGRF